MITDQDGNQIEFLIIEELEYNNNRYLLVVDTELLDDDEAEAVILKETGSGEDDFLYEELDDDEYDEVVKLFNESMDDFEIEI